MCDVFRPYISDISVKNVIEKISDLFVAIIEEAATKPRLPDKKTSTAFTIHFGIIITVLILSKR